MKRRIWAIGTMLLALALPLSALGGEGRIDIGVDGFLIFSDTAETTEMDTDVPMRTGFVLPLLDMGFYGQLNVGNNLHFGAGLRGFSVILATAFMPTVYTELDLWRFTLAAQVGGGFFVGLAGFSSFFLLGDVMLPELSLWVKLGKTRTQRVGVGAFTMLGISQFSYMLPLVPQNMLFYLAYRGTVR
jgi:hypothetical protein